MTEPVSFQIDIREERLEDLRRRLRNTRWPEPETVSDWSQGVPLDYLQEVCDYWLNQYDWRACEARLNRFAQFMMPIDGLDIHFIHKRSPERDARPLLITHGWPGSIVEFHKVIDALTDPVAHGGRAEDAFHVVAPSLPGYGFSGKPAATGWGVEKIADTWSALMQSLGYAQYYAQGGDWGAVVTHAIAARDPAHCLGVHVNLAFLTPDPDTMDDLTEFERGAIQAMTEYSEADSGYAKQQSTRPQSLAYGLVDSPVGQAAWILEKFWKWTDCDGHPESVLSRDEMLDNIMLYWLPATAGSSARLYWESFSSAMSPEQVQVPLALSMFPREIFRASRRWAEKHYGDKLVYFNYVERGGHFAAFEQPELFVRELREGMAAMR